MHKIYIYKSTFKIFLNYIKRKTQIITETIELLIYSLF